MKFIKMIIEKLKDPKKRSLTLLTLYFFFFVFVFMILNSSSNNTPVKPTEEKKEINSVSNFKEMTSYEYKINYTTNNVVTSIDGVYYNNTSLFNYNGIKYYLDDQLYVVSYDSYSLGSIEYNVSKLFNNNLSSIIDDLVLVSETTFTTGVVKKSYTYDSNKFYKYYYDTDSTFTNNISIDVTEDKDYITNIVIDLTNLGSEMSKIEISYSNINNIKSLDFNKENYIYKE